MLLIEFLFLVSLAFVSKTSNPSYLQTILAAEVLPIPGGPLNKQALAFIFGKSYQL
jgi:hypothetical protein